MSDESGYRFDAWLEWMDAHATIRPDGRVTHLGRSLLPESHRNTLALWYEHCERIPLGRWDEILVAAGLHLTTDFEHWLEEYCGSNGFEGECDHEAPPYPEAYWDDVAEPLNPPRFDRIVPCIFCDAPLKRARHTGHLMTRTFLERYAMLEVDEPLIPIT